MHTVTLEEAQARLPELAKKAATGEEIVIMENEKPLARLAAPVLAEVSNGDSKRWKGFGLLKGEIEMSPDFDEPLEEFREYME